jgi:hypothetical protein
MPLVQENLDRLNGHNYFSAVGMKDAYYHIAIRPEDWHYYAAAIIPVRKVSFRVSGSPSNV